MVLSQIIRRSVSGGRMSNSISHQAMAGSFWMISAYGLSKAVALGANVVLARLLVPEDFGVYALAGTVVGIVGALADLGTGAAVVYKQQPDNDYTNSAFWLGMLAGVAQSVIIIGGAQWISQLYGETRIHNILLVFGLVPTIWAFGFIPQMLLSKDLRFKAKAVVELFPGLSSAVITIVLAFFGLGVWSLVLGTAIGWVSSNTLAWWLVAWRPSFHFDLTKAKEVLSYGKSMFGMTMVVFFTDNIDYMVVGRLLGAASLGLYSQAFRLATYPESTIALPVEKVAFPTFSRIRENKESLHSAFLKAIEYMAIISFPFLTMLMVLSRELVLTLYGDKWEGLILPLQILCFAGMSRSATSVSKQMLMAVGRPDIAFKCNLLVFPGAVISVVIGTQFGIVGVAIGMGAMLSMSAWILLVLAARRIDLPVRSIVVALKPAVAASVVALAGLLLFRTVFSEVFSTAGIWNLAYLILVGCFLCLLGLVLFSRQVLSEILGIALSFGRNRDDEVWTSLSG